MRCAVRVWRVSGAWLINFHEPEVSKGNPVHRKDTQRIQFSLCLRKKRTNFGLRRMVCEPFTIQRACVYEALGT